MNTLAFEVTDGVGWIRLARPEKHNPSTTSCALTS